MLSRRHGETIEIDTPHGETIIVTLTMKRCGNMGVHIAAPRDYRIRRGELPRIEAA